MIQDLEKGDPLSAALESNIGRYLPDFYLMGIARAEGRGQLDTALPVLADQLKYPSSVSSGRDIEVYYAMWKICISLTILFFVTTTILPRFDMIFDEL